MTSFLKKDIIGSIFIIYDGIYKIIQKDIYHTGICGTEHKTKVVFFIDKIQSNQQQSDQREGFS